LEFSIAYLADHPHHIPILAQWHCAQWLYLCPSDSVERRIAALHQHLGYRQIPVTFVALAQETLLGSASLIAHDMDTRMNLSPWLASVYVAPAYRNQGVGSALVGRVVKEAGTMEIETLYLFTPDRERFYGRLGWSVVEHTEYRGYAQVIMSIPVRSMPQT
jgi:GNAT superfamily N-acetyltransferase